MCEGRGKEWREGVCEGGCGGVEGGCGGVEGGWGRWRMEGET